MKEKTRKAESVARTSVDLLAGRLKKLDLTQDDLFVCRDAAVDDDVAANLALQCERRTI